MDNNQSLETFFSFLSIFFRSEKRKQHDREEQPRICLRRPRRGSQRRAVQQAGGQRGRQRDVQVFIPALRLPREASSAQGQERRYAVQCARGRLAIRRLERRPNRLPCVGAPHLRRTCYGLPSGQACRSFALSTVQHPREGGPRSSQGDGGVERCSVNVQNLIRRFNLFFLIFFFILKLFEVEKKRIRLKEERCREKKRDVNEIKGYENYKSFFLFFPILVMLLLCLTTRKELTITATQ